MDSLNNPPKKRGRKPKQPNNDVIQDANVEIEPKIPKKRGRKPKNNIEEPSDKLKIPKKRGRKPKEKLFNIVKKSIDSNINTNESIILHLPITLDELTTNEDEISNVLNYNPNIPDEPVPYNNLIKENSTKQVHPYNNEDNFMLLQNNSEQSPPNNTDSNINNQLESLFSNETLSSINDNSNIDSNTELIETLNTPSNTEFNTPSNTEFNTPSNTEFNTPSNTEFNTPSNTEFNTQTNTPTNSQTNTPTNSHVMYSMNQFNIANNNNNWPKKTDIHCWWCCHSFDTVPVAIPTKYCTDSFTVYGCFCSYNCAMAYIFNTYNLNTWEQYSLLKLMYYKTTNLNTDIKCAPKKEILTKFGGTVDINSFRKSFTLYNLSYRYITPPMTSIISHIIEDSSNNNLQSVNQINENNFQSKINTQSPLTTQYKLKRVKSLINTKNSLEVTMGLKIN